MSLSGGIGKRSNMELTAEELELLNLPPQGTVLDASNSAGQHSPTSLAAKRKKR